MKCAYEQKYPVIQYPVVQQQIDAVVPSPAYAAQPVGAPSAQHDRPLILYAYSESPVGRENLEFFVSQGLHGAADFIFILNGETSAAELIPSKPNIQVIRRPNSCFDLGAFGEVLRDGGRWQRYKRFITLNASIRGPFLPHWSRGSCWSDLYLARVTERTKLVGMTANCSPRFHVQSMIWATDATGMALLLHPPASSPSRADPFGAANEPVAFSACYDTMASAVHAEIGSTAVIRDAGYAVDVMMQAFHRSPDYAAWCEEEQVPDVLWDGTYYGSNVHPYETLFMKANRRIDTNMLAHLTEWHLAEGRTGWETCGSDTWTLDET